MTVNRTPPVRTPDPLAASRRRALDRLGPLKAMALEAIGDIGNPSLTVNNTETITWGTATDWDNAQSQSGVEHISTPGTIKLRGYDSFEDTDFSEYTNHQSTKLQQSTASPQEGSAHAVFQGQSDWPLNFERTAWSYANADTIFARMYVAPDVNSNSGADMRGSIAFGIQDVNNFYFCSVRESNSKHSVEIVSSGSQTSEIIAISDSIADGEWYIHELTHNADTGDITLNVLNPDGTSVGSGSTTDTTYAGGTLGFTAYRGVDHYIDEYIANYSTAGSLTTAYKSYSGNVDVSSLELQNVSATLNSESITVYVESDTDADGVTEETSDAISLDGSGGPYSVTGLTTNSDTFALRIEPSRASASETNIPEFSGADLTGNLA